MSPSPLHRPSSLAFSGHFCFFVSLSPLRLPISPSLYSSVLLWSLPCKVEGTRVGVCDPVPALPPSGHVILAKSFHLSVSKSVTRCFVSQGDCSGGVRVNREHCVSPSNCYFSTSRSLSSPCSRLHLCTASLCRLVDLWAAVFFSALVSPPLCHQGLAALTPGNSVSRVSALLRVRVEPASGASLFSAARHSFSPILGDRPP